MFPSFQIFNETIYTYPMLMGIAWALGINLSLNLNRTSISRIKNIFPNLVGLFVFCWIGAKLFFLYTSDQIEANRYLYSQNFWIGGGFVFYGGALFGILYILLWSKISKTNLENFSFLVPGLTLGHAVGRIGCFMAGCCYGKADEIFNVFDHYPTQLIESGYLFLLTIILLKRLKNNREIILFYLMNYSLFRFCIEFLRGDLIRGTYFGLSTSQLIALALILITLILYIRRKQSK